MLPSCPAMLDINGISITSKVFHNLVDAYTRPLYMSCVQKKFEWDDTTVKAIAWDSLSLALNRIDRPVLMTKISNNLLPTKSFIYSVQHIANIHEHMSHMQAWRDKWTFAPMQSREQNRMAEKSGKRFTKNTQKQTYRVRSDRDTGISSYRMAGHRRGVYTTIPGVL